MEAQTWSHASTPNPVLLVDDAPLIRQRLRSFLVEATPGLRIAEAGGVADAEKQFDALDPVVVVLDLGLPDGNGLDAIRHVREAKRSCAVVVLTNDAEPETRRRCSELGADFVFTKSDEFEEAVEAVRRAAGGGRGIGRVRVERVVSSPRSLGERPAVLLAKLARRFDSKIELSWNGRKADARSFLGLLLLGVPGGEKVEVALAGSDAVEASRAIEKLFASGFREETEGRPEPAAGEARGEGLEERRDETPPGARLRLRWAVALARCDAARSEEELREIVKGWSGDSDPGFEGPEGA
jgi:phosphotransferase system HPr (HPr) family protein